MSTPDHDEKTRALVASAGRARARVAADIQELAQELTVDELKDRALNVAERSLEGLAERVLRRVSELPRWLANAARERPLAATAIVGLGAGVFAWRALRRR